MHSFLLIGPDENTLETKAQHICDQHTIARFDKTAIKKDKSIGIEDIRNLQKELLLTPLQSPFKAGIVYHADTMTIDAQNAFLKTLEEPPAHTIIILLAQNKEHFLPTVLSRCTILYEETPHIVETLSEDGTFLHHIDSAALGTKLKQAETISKSKDTAIAWIESSMSMLRKELYTRTNPQNAQKIRKLAHAYTLLKKTNANTRIIMEHLLLSL